VPSMDRAEDGLLITEDKQPAQWLTPSLKFVRGHTVGNATGRDTRRDSRRRCPPRCSKAQGTAALVDGHALILKADDIGNSELSGRSCERAAR